MADLQQIQTFVEVARVSSFTQAARRLSLPRSTVTARIRALEERLNIRLFNRTTRRVTLTDEGQRYFSDCEAAIDALLRAEETLKGTADPAGTIRMTVPIDFPKAFLAHTLSSFAERYPGVDFAVDVSDTPIDLVANNIDIAVRGRQVGAPGLIARRLGTHRMALFATPETSRAHGGAADILARLPVLDPAGVLPAGSKQRGPAPTVATRNFELAKALTLATEVIAVLPEDLCVQEIASGQLVEVPCEAPPPALPHFAVMPSRSHLPRRVRLFADYLAARLAAGDAPE